MLKSKRAQRDLSDLHNASKNWWALTGDEEGSNRLRHHVSAWHGRRRDTHPRNLIRCVDTLLSAGMSIDAVIEYTDTVFDVCDDPFILCAQLADKKRRIG